MDSNADLARIAVALESIAGSLGQIAATSEDVSATAGRLATFAVEAHPRVMAVIDRIGQIVNENAGKGAAVARLWKRNTAHGSAT